MMTSLLDNDNDESKNDGVGGNTDFTFLQSLAVHTGSVRCLDVLKGTDVLISGSIDTSAKMFLHNNATGLYAFEREFSYHEGFVYDVLG